MSQIVQPKTYTGKELETNFFRPILSGPDANDLGIKILYNMPVPTTINFWRRSGDILQQYHYAGWNGSNQPDRYQKTIELHKVKAEMEYSASDYFTMVYELITNRADVNLDDLSGTELEEAETELFRQAIAESVRVTMWLGNTSRSSGFNTFDGFMKKILEDVNGEDPHINCMIFRPEQYSAVDAGEAMLKSVWDNANLLLKEFKSQGQLAFFVTSDVYTKYEESLDRSPLESAYVAKQNGRESLCYRGIPVIDVQVSRYGQFISDIPYSFIVLTDRRNLALALNTADFPGTEVRMWYNPDEMQNRQRAVFMAGCDFLLPELVSIGYKG